MKFWVTKAGRDVILQFWIRLPTRLYQAWRGRPVHVLLVWIFVYAFVLHLIWAFDLYTSHSVFLAPSIVFLGDIWPNHNLLASILVLASLMALSSFLVNSSKLFGLLIAPQQILLLMSAFGSIHSIVSPPIDPHLIHLLHLTPHQLHDLAPVFRRVGDWHITLQNQAPNIVAAFCHTGGIAQHYLRNRRHKPIGARSDGGSHGG